MKRHGRVVALVAAVGVGVGAPAAIVVAMVLLLGVVVAVAFSSASFEVPERDHLQAIPIEVASCPYVAGMHEAANQFQVAYPALALPFEDDQPIPWPEAKMRLDRAATVLEGSIVLSVEHFPPQVQKYLTATRDALVDGRAQLSVASDGPDFVVRTSDLFQEGQLAFGYAGDLIGSQCPVPLPADSGTMFDPLMRSTVPEAAAPTQ